MEATTSLLLFMIIRHGDWTGLVYHPVVHIRTQFTHIQNDGPTLMHISPAT